MSLEILKDDPVDDLGPTPPPPAEPASKRRGCLVYGCLTVVVLVVVIGLLLWWFVTSTVSKYTDDEPRPLPVVTLPPERVEALQERASAFEEAVEKPEIAEEPPSLVLSEEEVNTLLLRENPGLRGKIVVRLGQDRLTAELSLPLDFLGLRLFKGRFFHGRAVLDVSVRDGKVFAMVEDLQVNGRPLPRVLDKAIRDKNLGEELHFRPETQKYMDRIKSLDVKDHQLIIRARPKPKPKPKPADEPAPEDPPEPAKGA